jgi:hypothetical protein
MTPPSIPAHLYQPTFAQNLHVMRKGGLRDGKTLQELAGTHLSIGEMLDDLQSIRIAQSFANQRDIHFVHANTSH